MNKNITILFAAILFLSFINEVKSQNNENKFQPDSSGYAEINNVKLYYEISGEGEPLIYLHGGISSCRDFDNYISGFIKTHKVITYDRRGHGRSYDSDEQLSYSSMADEANLFLEYLGIDSAYVIGWSDGGVVGLQLAARYPSKVRKLVAVGANYLVSGMAEGSVEWISANLTPENISKSIPGFEDNYKSTNPDPDNFAGFVNRTREMWLRDPYVAKEGLQKITAPVLLVSGDREDMKPEHTSEMYSIIKNAQLCILPNMTHFVFGNYNTAFMELFLRFIKE